MATVRVRGIGLPFAEPVDLCAVDGVWVAEHDSSYDVIVEGWLTPGLADVHTHPGAADGEPFDEKVLRDDMREHAAAGVTLIRAPGLAGDPPSWFGSDPDLPRAQHAGPWIARGGQFFEEWGLRPGDAEMAKVAAEQASRTGWCKIIGDWLPADDPVPLEVMRHIVDAVHAVGGRVAVHSQNAAGGAIAVEAGVDSLEHGMHLDPDLLPTMAAQGTALVPTLWALQDGIDEVRARPASARRDWTLTGVDRHGALICNAVDAGVTVLAGTDSHPMGRIADEVRALAGVGVPPQLALGAASWIARTYLGLPGLVAQAPADAVVYDTDPREDLDALDHPRCVIIGGRIATASS